MKRKRKTVQKKPTVIDELHRTQNVIGTHNDAISRLTRELTQVARTLDCIAGNIAGLQHRLENTEQMAKSAHAFAEDARSQRKTEQAFKENERAKQRQEQNRFVSQFFGKSNKFNGYFIPLDDGKGLHLLPVSEGLPDHPGADREAVIAAVHSQYLKLLKADAAK